MWNNIKTIAIQVKACSPKYNEYDIGYNITSGGEDGFEEADEENKAFHNFHKNNTGCSGSKNGRAILNEGIVYDIRLRKKNGEH